MDPNILRAIIDVVVALIAAGGAAWGANRLMAYQIKQLQELVGELKKEVAPFLSELAVLKVRLDTVEREIKELKEIIREVEGK